MRFLSIAAFVCLGVVAAQEIQFDYDRSANFSAYHTYQWVNQPSGQAGNQLMDQNIKRAIESQLALKGLRPVESGADLKLTYQVGIQKEKQFDGWGTGPRFYGSGRVSTSTVENGKLTVGMVDSSRNQLVWQGAAEKTLDIKSDPDKNFRNLEKTVAKLFKNYPPGPASK